MVEEDETAGKTPEECRDLGLWEVDLVYYSLSGNNKVTHTVFQWKRELGAELVSYREMKGFCNPVVEIINCVVEIMVEEQVTSISNFEYRLTISFNVTYLNVGA